MKQRKQDHEILKKIVGAWLTVIPTITSFGEATLFLTYSPIGTGVTLF